MIRDPKCFFRLLRTCSTRSIVAEQKGVSLWVSFVRNRVPQTSLPRVCSAPKANNVVRIYKNIFRRNTSEWFLSSNHHPKSGGKWPSSLPLPLQTGRKNCRFTEPVKPKPSHALRKKPLKNTSQNLPPDFSEGRRISPHVSACNSMALNRSSGRFCLAVRNPRSHTGSLAVGTRNTSTVGMEHVEP